MSFIILCLRMETFERWVRGTNGFVWWLIAGVCGAVSIGYWHGVIDVREDVRLCPSRGVLVDGLSSREALLGVLNVRESMDWMRVVCLLRLSEGEVNEALGCPWAVDLDEYFPVGSADPMFLAVILTRLLLSDEVVGDAEAAWETVELGASLGAPSSPIGCCCCCCCCWCCFWCCCCCLLLLLLRIHCN